MSAYFVMMAVAAFLAAVSCIAFGQWRGLLWICVGAASFIVSVFYAYSGLANYPSVALLLDAAVCLAIYFRYEQAWEKLVYVCFLVMVSINLVFQASLWGFLSPIDVSVYSGALEVVNYAALVIIGGTPVFQKARQYGDRSARLFVRRLGLIGDALSQARRTPPFTLVR